MCGNSMNGSERNTMFSETYEFPEEYIGVSCSVYSDLGKKLYEGTIDSYDSIRQELAIMAKDRREVVFDDLQYGTNVKIFLRLYKLKRTIVVFYGTILRSLTDCLFISLKQAEALHESRKHFRIETQSEARIQQLILLPDTNEIITVKESNPCHVVDVSIKGIGFWSPGNYNVGDVLLLSDLEFESLTVAHQFYCVIRRKKQDETKKQSYFYGCEFIAVPTRAEDELCRDIFLLQTKKSQEDAENEQSNFI